MPPRRSVTDPWIELGTAILSLVGVGMFFVWAQHMGWGLWDAIVGYFVIYAATRG